MNHIFLRRQNKAVVSTGLGTQSLAHAATLQKEIEQLGFLFTLPMLQALQSCPITEMTEFQFVLLKTLRERVGSHRSFHPLYPDFPTQVMALPDAELYLNAVIHYWTDGQYFPAVAPSLRPALATRSPTTAIDFGSKEEFEAIFTRLAGARSSLSIQDREDITWFIKQYRDSIFRLMPASLPIKENATFVCAELLKHTSNGSAFVAEQLKTATDILRLAAAWSDGDISLATPCKFVKFKRSLRKFMLGALEACGARQEDMQRHPEEWKRLGEVLHPGDYAHAFPLAYGAFSTLRQGAHIQSFNSRVEAKIVNGDTVSALALLEKRPGELVRRVSTLLRMNSNSTYVLTQLRNVANQVATPVLLQALVRFKRSARHGELRMFFPKGEVAKIFAYKEERTDLPIEMECQAAHILESVLIERFAALPNLGSCYIDPRMKDFLVPFSQRSAAKALRTLVRGSKLPLPESRFLRLFLWWKNGAGRTDIDLSVAVYREDFSYLDTLAYYNLKGYGCYHSGDVVDAPNGAAEFIDLDAESIRAAGGRYVIASLNSFTSQAFCDLPECFAGWMARTCANSGEIFEPRTVQDKVDLSAKARMCLPVIFDLVGKKVIWADIALSTFPSWNNVRNNLSGVSLMLRSMVQINKPNLYELFELHVKARGTQVETQTQANTVFALDAGIGPYDLDVIRADFL